MYHGLVTFEADDIMSEVGLALGEGQQGDREGARLRLQALWDRVGGDGDAFHRCAIAHSMADVQDDLHDVLRWDLIALSAADELTDDRVAAGGVAGSAASLYPSLHLNLADVYLRLAERESSLEHVVAGRAALVHLDDDGYRAMISEALERVERQLTETTESPDRRDPPIIR